MTNAVSIEPEKPRLVTAPFALNEATRKQPVVLEGLDEVRENVRWNGSGECPSQTGHDQKSGYNNLLISDVGRALFVFATFGFLFCENTVPFGRMNAACCQQRGSTLAMGFMRCLGALGSACLDDSHLSSGGAVGTGGSRATGIVRGANVASARARKTQLSRAGQKD